MNQFTSCFRNGGVALSVVLLGVGCGCAKSSAPALNSPSLPSSSMCEDAPKTALEEKADHPGCDGGGKTADELVQQINQSERELYARLGAPMPVESTIEHERLGAAGTAVSPPLPAAVPSEPAAAKSAPRGTSSPEAQSLSDENEQACTHACSAYQSLHRSVERLCELTGASDERCSQAKDRRTRAQAQVRSKCSECM